MATIQTINGHFYLREEPLEVGEARDESHAKLWAHAQELSAMIERLISLVPDQGGLLGYTPHPIVKDARALLERLK